MPTLVIRYVAAALGAATAVALRLALRPALGPRGFEVVALMVALAAVAFYAGPGPALLCLALGAVGTFLFVLPPTVPGSAEQLQHLAGVSLYTIAGAGVAALAYAMRRYRERAAKSERQLGTTLASKRIERQLERQNELLALASQAGSVGFFEYSFDEDRATWSSGIAKLLGVPADEFDGSRPAWVGRLVPEDANELERRLAAAVAARLASVDFEYRAILPDGTTRWVAGRGALSYSPDGRPVRLIGMNVDINEWKLAERALHESEERFRAFMDNSPARAWLKDDAGRYVFVNRAGLSGLRMAADAVLGRTDAELFPTAGEAPRRTDLAVLSSGTAIELFESVDEPAGRREFVTVKFPVEDSEGRRYIGGMAVDITEERRARVALRESEQRFRIMADVTPVMIWVTSAAGEIEFVNRAYVEFFGITEEQLRHPGTWQRLVHPEDLDRYVAAYRDALQSRGLFVAECRVRHADGGWRWIASYAAPRFSAGGQFIGHVGSSPDITAFKRAEQDLKDADRRKDEFLATLAHELRHPLAPIRTSLHLLKLHSVDPLLTDRLVTIMERQVGHLVRLVDDLLEIGRITSGKLEIRVEAVDLSAILESSVESIVSTLSASGKALTLRVPPERLIIDADPVRVTQIIANLLHNAAKFTSEGGSIWLTATRADGWAQVCVRDDGIGMPAEMLPHVFEPLVQIEENRPGVQPGGLGLGLYLVRRLVEMHGGTVEARSEGTGKGSEIIVRLPLGSPSAVTAAGVRTDPMSASSTTT